MRCARVSVGVPFSTAAAILATVSPGCQRQRSALSQTSAKLGARLAKPGRQSPMEHAVSMSSLLSWDEAVSTVREIGRRWRRKSPFPDLTTRKAPPRVSRLTSRCNTAPAISESLQRQLGAFAVLRVSSRSRQKSFSMRRTRTNRIATRHGGAFAESEQSQSLENVRFCPERAVWDG